MGSKKEVEVIFRTITPLWTGDAWGENREVRPSSLIGSLRFWFSVYWKIEKNKKTENLDSNGVPKENLKNLEKLKKQKFEKLLIEKLKEASDFDEAIDKVLEELDLSVPSRIFGCTGWKSRIRLIIKSFSKEEISLDEVEFRYPKSINTYFWIKKNLFRNKGRIAFFKDVKVTLITTEYWWKNYLKEFFDFFRNKFILAGGKISFSLGFINLNSSFNDCFLSKKPFLIIKKIENIPYQGNKEVLGFNFKYYLRKGEEKGFREVNFGKQGKASKIYVTNLLKQNNNSIYLLLLNDPFDNEQISYQIFNKYLNLLNKLRDKR